MTAAPAAHKPSTIAAGVSFNENASDDPRHNLCYHRLVDSRQAEDDDVAMTPTINIPQIDHATLVLLAQWDKEDETNDPVEIARRNQDFDELKTALNQNRAEAGGPEARKVFP